MMTMPSGKPGAEIEKSIETGLPPLPSSVRYYDDFLDIYRSIRDIAQRDVWAVESDGEKNNIHFTRFPERHIVLMKHAAVVMFGTLDPDTVVRTVNGISALAARGGESLIDSMIHLRPWEMRNLWETSIRPQLAQEEASVLKRLLRVLCELNIGHWTVEQLDYISRFVLPPSDSYKAVRTGECFIPLAHQALIVDHFDELVERLAKRPDRVEFHDLRDACNLLFVFEHALRPGQVARIRNVDVRVHSTGAVHFSAVLTKKRRAIERGRVTRRIKREWTPIVEQYKLRRASIKIEIPGIPPDSFLGFTPSEVSRAVRDRMTVVTGTAWTPTDLRHTAAQRLVDSGISHIAVSEFMGHSSIQTANVYFDTSPTQAQRVNQALAISPVYSAVAEVARTRTIDMAALLELSPDHHVAGVPHGIPITGIGACEIGQSLCAKNPVFSCYTCIKFLAFRDANIHRQVAEDLRPVVMEFAAASRGNETSPAFTQLRTMLTAVEKVADEIDSGGTLE